MWGWRTPRRPAGRRGRSPCPRGGWLPAGPSPGRSTRRTAGWTGRTGSRRERSRESSASSDRGGGREEGGVEEPERDQLVERLGDAAGADGAELLPHPDAAVTDGGDPRGDHLAIPL